MLPLAPERAAMTPAPDPAPLLEELATLRLENAALRMENGALRAENAVLQQAALSRSRLANHWC